MKRTLSLVLSLVLFCSIFSCLSVTVNAASASDCLSFYGESDKWYVTSCKTTASGSLVIPSTQYSSHNGYKPVIGIRSDAFKNCTKLTSITIPSSITSIASSAFEGCTSLTSITVNSANEYFSSADGVLFNKDMTTLIRYPIGKTATSFTIPNTVTSIGEYAFSGCTNLTSITIPDTVTHIGYNAFDNTGYYNDSANWSKGVLYINNHFIKAKTSVVAENILREGTVTIAGGAFEDCIGLTTLIIPNSVTSLGAFAFEDCTSLTSITIPKSVTNIGNGAFFGCSSLTAITIPENVTRIGEMAFYNCTGLKEVNWNAKNVGDYENYDYVFYNAGNGMEVVFGDTVENIPAHLFYVRDSSYIPRVTKVTIGNNVTNIGESAFENCASLQSITIPKSVTSIGNSAFYDCVRLSAVYITDIAKWCGIAFGSYSANPIYKGANLYLNGKLITELVIPKSVSTIPLYAFYNCKSLTSITIPDSVKTIGKYAFSDCAKLTSIIISDSVISIDNCAFNACTNLKNVYYHGMLIDWGEIAVGDGNSCLLDATFSHLCTYNDWIVDNIASCSETGSKHRTCRVCGEIVTEEIPTISHTPSDWKVDTQATVSVPGSKHTECTVCGTMLETASIPQLKTATPKVKAVNTIAGMKVTWNAVEGAAKYVVYRRLGTSSTWSIIATTTGLSFEDKGSLVVGNYYVYSVKAYNSADIASDYIKANCASVQRVVAPYTNAKNALAGINVTWNKIAGANKYIVLRRIGTESTWTTLCTTTGTSFLDKNVTPGIYYLYSIRAVNNTGYSEYDVNKRITVQRVVAPYTKAANTNDGINVTWGKVAGANKYVVLRRIGTESTWTTLCTTTGTSFLDKNVTPGIYYLYSIRAVNNTGYSEYDVNKRVTIKRASRPTTPKVVTTNLINGVQVKWNAVTGATKYNVYKRRAYRDTWVYLGTTTGTLFIDKDVDGGFSYVYSVRAYTANGLYSEYNSSKAAINFWVGIPTAVAKNTTNGVQIKWNLINASHYEIYRRVAGSSNWTLIGTTKELSFVDKNVKKGTYYVYSVRAVITGYPYTDYDYISAYDTNKTATIKYS